MLQKVNKSKQVFSEKSLRDTLDKMQVSLIKHNTEEVYLRSAPAQNETLLQQQMGVKSLPSIVAVAKAKLSI